MNDATVLFRWTSDSFAITGWGFFLIWSSALLVYLTRVPIHISLPRRSKPWTASWSPVRKPSTATTPHIQPTHQKDTP